MQFPGQICFPLLWLYQCETSYMKQNIYIFCPISTFGLLFTIVDRLKVSDTPYLDGNLFSKSTTPSISYLFIRLVYLLNVISWHVALARSLIVHIDRSIISTCSLFVYMCSKPGSKDISNYFMLNSLSLC